MTPISYEFPPIQDTELQMPLMRYGSSDYLVCGIYFLFQGVTLRYIGQSESVLSRISSHKAAGKIFDSFAVFRCGKDWLLPLEAAFIRKYLPPENRAHTKSDLHVDRSRENVFVDDVTICEPPKVTPDLPRFVRVKEAASMLCLSKSSLDKMRIYGGGPAFSKLGSSVVYHTNDLIEWGRKRHSFHEAAA